MRRGLVEWLQYRAEPGKDRCLRIASFVPDDQGHRFHRQIADISGFNDVLSQADLPQSGDALRVLQRLVPLPGGRHKNSDRLLRLDIHVIALAGRVRAVGPRRVIVGGIQPHTLVIGRQPIENSISAAGQRMAQQTRKTVIS